MPLLCIQLALVQSLAEFFFLLSSTMNSSAYYIKLDPNGPKWMAILAFPYRFSTYCVDPEKMICQMIYKGNIVLIS